MMSMKTMDYSVSVEFAQLLMVKGSAERLPIYLNGWSSIQVFEHNAFYGFLIDTNCFLVMMMVISLTLVELDSDQLANKMPV